MESKAVQSTSRFDALKWLVVFVLIAVGVVGNQYFSAESVLYRVLALPGWLCHWRHLEGPGCIKWCHSQPKSTFHVKSIKKSSVFEGDIDFDRFITAT